MLLRLVLTGAVVLICFSASYVEGFALTGTASCRAGVGGLLASPRHEETTRRSLLTSTAAAVLGLTIPFTARADTGADVRGIGVTPFNSLMFQYRGSEYGGIKASDIDGPSVSYADFVAKLKAGEVDFVEFLAPDGDVAYATFKGQKPIRIGEGKCRTEEHKYTFQDESLLLG